MRIISVVAPGNGSGKTRAVCSLLEAFAGRLAAIKFTTVYRDGANCPRSERTCACRSLQGPFTIITDRAVLHEEGTDTHLMARAGASSVTWCVTAQGAQAEAWNHLRSELLPPDADLITEGNSVVDVLDPDRVIMILSPLVEPERWKEGTWELMRRADRVFVNTHGSAPAGVEALISAVAPVTGGRGPVAVDVSAPLSAWPGPSLLDDIEGLLGSDSEAGR